MQVAHVAYVPMRKTGGIPGRAGLNWRRDYPSGVWPAWWGVDIWNVEMSKCRNGYLYICVGGIAIACTGPLQFWYTYSLKFGKSFHEKSEIGAQLKGYCTYYGHDEALARLKFKKAIGEGEGTGVR